MVQEVDRLNRVVGQLLDLSRPINVSKAPMDIAALVENSLPRIRPQLEQQHLQIDYSTTGNPGAVPLDADRFQQVLMNLYVNAIDAMEPGGCISVAAGRTARPAGVWIRVADTGPGIPEDALAHVFDPYFTTKSTGTGLGLAIVHNIVEAHGGSITVNNLPQAGAEFTIMLPEERDR
jgi:two-component system sensor histidine kinase HydH